MRRFFVHPAAISGAVAVIADAEAHHLTAVLRLAAGARIVLFDGTGMTYDARITRISQGRVEAVILSAAPDQARPGPELHVGLALLKGKKMEFIVQKATELGVAGLYPFISRFCVNRGGQTTGREGPPERWQRIALEACKQCGRPTPPLLAQVRDFGSVLTVSQPPNGAVTRLIFWEGGSGDSLTSIFPAGGPSAGAVMILIGPEGGFSGEEVAQARAAGFQPVSLGRRILRAETAALTAIAIIQYLLGNLE